MQTRMVHTRPPLVMSSVLLLILAGGAGMSRGQSAPKVTSTASVAAFQGRAESGQNSLPQTTGPRVTVPTMPRLGYARYPWKTDITATVFWVGEKPAENNPTPNNKSSWDTEWEKNFGGYDDPDPSKRNANYCPAEFVPGQNPFYIALPYNDCQDHKAHKSEAEKVIPWFKDRFVRSGKSVLKGTWVAIRYGNRVCYAQWEDCGPFVTDDHEYVFGSARPKNTSNSGAGIDISPAVRDYLGIPSKARCDWRFVDTSEVPPGPWRTLGANNPFVRAQEEQKARQQSESLSRLDELRRLRDAYFQQNGNDAYRTR